MEYIKPANEKAYIRECFNVTSALGKIISNPKAKLSDVIVTLTAILVMLVAGLGLCIWMVAVMSEKVFVLMIGSLLMLIILYVVRILRIKNSMNQVSGGNRTDSVFNCSTEGAIRSSSRQCMTVYWSSVQCIRVYKYCLVVLPKDNKTSTLMAPVENLDALEAFLKENAIDIPVVK